MKPPFLCALDSTQLNGFRNFSAVFCSQQHFKFFQAPFRIWIMQAWSATHTHSVASTSCASSHEQEVHAPSHTHSVASTSCASSHERPNPHSQRSIYFMCTFTWAWSTAPSHTHSVASTSCASSNEQEVHAPTHTHSVASASCTSSHERQYMPQPTPTA